MVSGQTEWMYHPNYMNPHKVRICPGCLNVALGVAIGTSSAMAAWGGHDLVGLVEEEAINPRHAGCLQKLKKDQKTIFLQPLGTQVSCWHLYLTYWEPGWMSDLKVNVILSVTDTIVNSNNLMPLLCFWGGFNENASISLCIWVLGPQWVELFGKDLEEEEDFLEEMYYWGWAWKLQKSHTIPS